MSPLLKDKPNLIRNAILRSVFSDLPLVPTLLTNIINGYNIDTDSYYRYGDTGGYPLGLPEGNKPLVNIRYDSLDRILSVLHNVPEGSIIYDSVRFNYPTPMEAAIYILSQNFSRNKETGLVTKGLDILPENYVAEIVSAVFRYTNEINDDDFKLTPSFSFSKEKYLMVTLNVYDPVDKVGTEAEFVHEILLYTEDDRAAEHRIDTWEDLMYVVTYQIPKLPLENEEFYLPTVWVYSIETNLYPSLNVYDIEDLKSPYYPVAPIRVDKQFIGTNHSNSFYKDLEDPVNKLLGYVGTDFNTIKTALEDNPDIADIDGSYLIFGLPIGYAHGGAIITSTMSQAKLKYLYRYLEYLKDNVQVVDKAAFLASELTRGSNAPLYNVLQINDSELKTSIHWNYIEITNETYIPPNTGAGLYETRTGNDEYQLSTNEDLQDEADPTNLDFYCKSPMVIYKHDDVNLTRTKIIISGVYTHQDVYPGKGVVHTLREAFLNFDSTNKDGFYFPLSRDILKTLNNSERQDVTFASVILISYAIKPITIKWYKREAFINLLRVVIVVVAFYSQNYELLALELTVTEIAYLVLEAILINIGSQIALSVIFSALVDIIGVDAAIVLAIAAIALGAADGADLVTLGATMPTAIQLINLATSLSDAIVADIGETLQKIGKKLAELQDEAAEIQKEIDEANALLPESLLDTTTMVEDMLRSEYPDDFFSRTINPGIGYNALNSIDYFYDNALQVTLPGINS